MLKKGLVQVYTGNGKGKTTAAFGLALRAAGQGLKVFIFQFLKPHSNSGELTALERLGQEIKLETLDAQWDLVCSLETPEHIDLAKTAISQAMKSIIETATKGIYGVIILDEIVFCLGKELVYLEQIKELIEKRSPEVEIILTGRGAPKELIELADLATEMVNIKHPFEKGIQARKGIEF
jgi:cob(I)alamin adenosyltransferase